MNFIEEEDLDPEKDFPRNREIEGYTVEQRDPFGFFYFVKKGKKDLPEALTGAFTSLLKVQDAIKAIKAKPGTP